MGRIRVGLQVLLLVVATMVAVLGASARAAGTHAAPNVEISPGSGFVDGQTEPSG